MSQDVTLLVVEADPDQLAALAMFTAELGIQTLTAKDGPEALETVKNGKVNMVLCDLHLPTMDGDLLCQRIRQHNPTIPVIILSAISSIERAVYSLKNGATDFLLKPVQPTVLRTRLATSLKLLAVMHEAEQLKDLIDRSFRPLENLQWGTSRAMLAIAVRLPKLARVSANVLLVGETGTGKELIARAIHYASRRANGPLVCVNCAAISEGLWEREFFGHVAGAFSDAGKGAPGLVSAARGGTLFLDEVGEIPLAMQAKLLRFLQEKEFRRVGATKSEVADLRVISATNRNLNQEMEGRRFREDLYYRLKVLQVEVPPLRKRKEDIPLLATQFLKRYAREYERAVGGFSPRAIYKLCSYDWPGNVRELENTIQQAVVEAEYPMLTANDILVGEDTIVEEDPTARVVLTSSTASPDDNRLADGLILRTGLSYNAAKERLIDEFEKQYVSAALAAYGGNVSRAAKAVGLSRRSFARVMHRHQILAGPEGRGGVPGRPLNAV